MSVNREREEVLDMRTQLFLTISALPQRLGKWNTQWRRFDRWATKGHLKFIADLLRNPELDVLILDSTVIRAHACAAGQGGKRGRACPRPLFVPRPPPSAFRTRL